MMPTHVRVGRAAPAGRILLLGVILHNTPILSEYGVIALVSVSACKVQLHWLGMSLVHDVQRCFVRDVVEYICRENDTQGA